MHGINFFYALDAALNSANEYPTVLWWEDTCKSSVVEEAVRMGWATRSSVTQAQWTTKGVDRYNELRNASFHRARLA